MPDSAVQHSRFRDLDKLLLRSGNLIGPNFEPGPQLRDDLQQFVKVLVVGAGGLGCELLKDLALSGFQNLEVIDMDRIEVSNLNRQFLFRLEDVGKPKAEVAARRVMERVSGVEIVPHFGRIEDKDIEFYNDFHIIALGLDSIEARSYINAVACSFLGAWSSNYHVFRKLMFSVPQASSCRSRPPARPPLMHDQQAWQRESQGTGVFIPRSPHPRMKDRNGRFNSRNSKINRESDSAQKVSPSYSLRPRKC